MKILYIAIMVFFALSRAAGCAEPDDSVTAVRSIINEATASFWSDAEIQEWLDQGVSDIAARSLCIQNADTFLLVTDQYEYTDFVTGGSDAASDITKVWGCVYLNPDDENIGLKRILPQQISDLPHSISGPPVYFYHFSNKIVIYPAPTSAENGDSVKIYTSNKPTGVSLALRIAELPSEYMNSLYWYSASQAYKKEHRYAESDKLYQMYISSLSYLKNELYDIPPEVRQ